MSDTPIEIDALPGYADGKILKAETSEVTGVKFVDATAAEVGADPAGTAAAAVAAHDLDTSVHGIPDTSLLYSAGGNDVAILDGGTGASTAADARTNLGLGTLATQNAATVTITGGTITGITDLAVADGGTGASTASGARTNLGLGTLATQNSNAVNITGGTISGVALSADLDFALTSSTAAEDIFSSKVTGDTSFRFLINADGQLEWGSGSALDVNLYRAGANHLATDDQFSVIGDTSRYFMKTSTVAGAAAFAANVTADVQARWVVLSSGEISWGAGTGSRDTNLYRAGANLLATDDQFSVRRTGVSDFAIETIVPGDSFARFAIKTDGGLLWGPGNATQDVNLFRSGVDVLATNDRFMVDGSAFFQKNSPNLTDAALSVISQPLGDTVSRFLIYADGKLEWGTGAATRDTNLYRFAANVLKTDDALTISQWAGVGIDASSGHQLISQAGAANRIAITARAAAAQTADIQQWQDSAGTSVVRLDPSGRISVLAGTTDIFSSTNATFGMNTHAAAATGLVVRGRSGQIGDLQRWQDSAGNTLARVFANGAGEFSDDVTVKGAAGTYRDVKWSTDGALRWLLYADNSAETGADAGSNLTLEARGDDGISTPGAVFTVTRSTGRIYFRQNVGIGLAAASSTRLVIQPAATTDVALIARGFSAQTGDLQQWQNSGTTNLARVTAAGQGVFSGVDISPTDGTGFIELTEQTVTPATPSANDARVYLRDNNGSTELVANFATGGPKVLASQFEVDEPLGYKAPALLLDGNGDYLSTPDHPALDITGDLDVRAKITPLRFSGSAIQQIVSKMQTEGALDGSYEFRINASGFLNLYWHNATPAGVAINSTTALSSRFSIGDTFWVRATLDADNGAAGHTVAFYTSTDNVSWSLLSSHTVAGVTAIQASTKQIEVGTRNLGGTDPFQGKIHSAEVRSGIDGPVVAKFDADRGFEGADPAFSTPLDEPFVHMSGAVNENFTTPDSVAVSVTGSIDIAARWASSVVPASNYCPIGKWNGAGLSSYALTVLSNGGVLFRFSADGTTAAATVSTAAGAFVFDGTFQTFRATYNVSTGAWVIYKNGTSIASGTGATGTIFDSTAQVEIGDSSALSNNLNGKVAWAELRNGIDGPVVARFDARDALANGVTTITDRTTGTVWTANNGPLVVTNTPWTSNGNAQFVDQSSPQGFDGQMARITGTSTTDDLLHGRVLGDTQPRITVEADGMLRWGPGNTTPDTNLYRVQANHLATDDRFTIVGDSTVYFQKESVGTTNPAYTARITADVLSRWIAYSDGKMEWGDGTAARDTNLYREFANRLRTDDRFHAADGLILGPGEASASSLASLQARSTTDTLLTVQGAAGQTASLVLFRDSTATVRSFIDANGNFRIRTGATGYGAALDVLPPTTGNVGAIIRAQAGQTANLQQWQSSAGSPLAAITASGALELMEQATAPAAPAADDALVYARDNNGYTELVADFATGGPKVLATQDPGAPPAVLLDGTSYLSAADAAWLDITGDIDIRVRVTSRTATHTTDRTLVGKAYGTGYWFVLTPTGGLNLGIHNGTSNVSVSTPNIVTPALASVPTWWRATRVQSSGAVVFYTSTDGVVWTTVHTATLSAGSAITATGDLLRVGQTIAGKIHEAEVRAGINGPVVARFDGDYGYRGAVPSFMTPLPEPFVLLDGVDDYLSTPDAAALDITGDLDLRAKVGSTAWVGGPVNGQVLMAKFGAAGQRSWRWMLTTNGALLLEMSTDGTTLVQASSGVVNSYPVGASKHLRVTWVASTGTTKFYDSSDGVTWTQVGTDKTIAIPSIFSSTATLEVGIRNAGSEPFQGKVFSAEARNGIDGPVVARFDAKDAVVNSQATITSRATGEVWTANNGAAVVVNTSWTSNGNVQFVDQASAKGFDGQQVRVTGQATTSDAIQTRVAGDTQPRFTVDADGALLWGSGTAAPDANLYRSSGDILKTDDSLWVGVAFAVGANGPGVAQALARVCNTSSTQVSLQLRGAASQSADLQQWQDSSGNTIARVSSVGVIQSTRSGTAVSAYQASISGEAVSRLQVNNDGAILWGAGAVAHDTNLYRQTTAILRTDHSFTIGNFLGVGTSAGSGAQAQIHSSLGSRIAATVRGASAQSVDIQQWQDSAGASLAAITASGALELAEQATAPAAPAADDTRIYARDNEGFTELVADFNTGGPKVLASQNPGTVPAIQLDGNGDFLSTADATWLDITGDLDLRVRATVGATTPAQTFIGKWDGVGNQRSYLFRIFNSRPTLNLSVDGTASLSVNSATDIPASLLGVPIHWRVTWVKATGLTTFYTSTDGVTWTVQGTAGTLAVASIFASTIPASVGVWGGGSEPLHGKVHSAEVRSGVNGVVVASFDADRGVEGAISTFADPLPRPFVYQDGVNDSVATPDSAALDLTGDIDLRAQAAFPSLPLTAEAYFPGKDAGTSAPGAGGYALTVSTDSKLHVRWSDGTTAFNVASTVVAPFVNGVPLFFRGTLDVDNGASGRTVTFYTSPDGVTWNQLGAPVVQAGVTSISTNTAVPGVYTTGAGVVHVMSVEVRNGIDGPVVARFDAKDALSNGATTITSRATGEVWNANNGALLVINTPWTSNGQAQFVDQKKVAQRCVVDVFTSSGTWRKRKGLVSARMIVISGGGGGGSGRRGAAGTVRCGGGGGRGGGWSEVQYNAIDLPDSLTVGVAGGGTGGAARTTDDTDGAAGVAGGSGIINSGTATYVRTSGGNAGSGGTATTGTGATGEGAGLYTAGSGGSASATGGVGGSGSGGGAGGGGAGGGVTAADSPSNGGTGASTFSNHRGFPTGGVAPGGNGSSNSDGAGTTANTPSSGRAGVGGGGGAGSTTTAGGAGALPDGYGGGGGGGGGTLNGFASGAGGAGAPGIVVVYNFF